MDRHGRVFFIDHKNRTTTWLKPVVTPPAAAAASTTAATTAVAASNSIDEANSELGANGGSELPGSYF